MKIIKLEKNPQNEKSLQVHYMDEQRYVSFTKM